MDVPLSRLVVWQSPGGAASSFCYGVDWPRGAVGLQAGLSGHGLAVGRNDCAGTCVSQPWARHVAATTTTLGTQDRATTEGSKRVLFHAVPFPWQQLWHSHAGCAFVPGPGSDVYSSHNLFSISSQWICF